jgi:phosphoribosylamine--glycine ligase
VNLLLLDSQHCFVAYAMRCMRFGHHVRVVMALDKEGRRVTTGDGLIEKVEREEWRKHMAWADLILMSDNDKWMREVDAYKRKGYPVFAPSPESAELELDRKKGQAFFEKHGLQVVPYQAFTDAKKAEKYVTAEMERFVCKPNNNQARELSYCAKSPKDMVFMLRRWDAQNAIKGEFMLQEFVDGIEVGVAGWLGPKGFAGYVEEFFEHKKLCNDDLGPATGETGTPEKYVPISDSQLAKELLLPLEADLIKMGHFGSFAVGAMVDKDGDPIPLEATCRMGWPSFQIVNSLHPDPCDWMAELIEGKDTFTPFLDHAIGVVVYQPPFPYDDLIKKCGGKLKNETLGIPLYGLNQDNPYFDHIAPSDVMDGVAPDDALKDQRVMVSTGDYLAVCTGVGETVRDAKAEAYKAIDSLDIPNSIGYRTDIGDRLRTALPKLQEFGFVSTWTY